MKIHCLKCHNLIFPSEEINGLCKYCRLNDLENLKNETNEKDKKY